jgi:hypothetical protein
MAGIQRVVFSPPCHWFNVLSSLEGPPLPGATGQVDPRRGRLSPNELGKVQEPTWGPHNQTGKNPSSNSDLPQEAEGESD